MSKLDGGMSITLEMVLDYAGQKAKRQLEINNPISSKWQELDSEIDTIVEMTTDLFEIDEFDVEMEIGRLAKESYEEDHEEEAIE